MTEYEATKASLVPTAPWHTASYSAERGACIEVSEGQLTRIRDTKHRELGALAFDSGEWRAFLSCAKDD